MDIGPKCPLCKKPLSIEMVAIGTDKGEEKVKPKLGAILSQIISYSVESAIRAYVGSGRSLYYTCNNGDCPLCYSPANPNYFKNTAFGPELVGDSLGIRMTLMRSIYKKKQKKKKM